MNETGLVEYLANITYYMQTYFPNVTVFPILGNHDTYPSFQVTLHPIVFATKIYGVKMYDYEYWLYEDAANIWSSFLADDMKETFISGGFYTTLLTTGLRIIALNTVLYCNSNNQVDPETNTGL